MKIYDSYHLDDKCRYLVGYNGGVIYDTQTKEIIKKHYLDEKYLKIATAIKDDLTKKGYKFIVGAYRLGDSIVFNAEAKERPHLVNNFLTFEGDFSQRVSSYTSNFSNDPDYLKMVYFFEPDHINDINFHHLQQEMSKKYKIPRGELVLSGLTAFELIPSGVSKGTAIKEISKLLNISLENTLSIGDSGNDISMFETTKYSATLASSPDFVKKHATHIFDAPASIVVADAINLLVLNDD